MKKSTLAVATLLTAISSAALVPAAFADDSAPTAQTSSCAASNCTACKASCAAETPAPAAAPADTDN